MASSFKTLREYLCRKDKTFVVPNYQRGYKWSVKVKVNDTQPSPSHVEKLCDDLIEAFTRKRDEYFLQGITVSEEANGKIVLIDGQQRTTTLYLLLWCFGKDNIKDINLDYDIRDQSKNFLRQFHEEVSVPMELKNNDDNQDIHYFRVAVEQIQKKRQGVPAEFVNYILDHVKILYIVIAEEKAVKTFTMMNGSKATMLPEELIKAEMLRLVSLPGTEKKDVSTSVDDNLVILKEIIARDWETNALRSRYAREWDKWLYWWSKPDVKLFFDVITPMGILLKYHFNRELRPHDEKAQNFTFQTFKDRLLQDNASAKDQFKKLRDLQKSFEDIFNTPKIHNYLKLAFIGADGGGNFEVITYFIDNKKQIAQLRDYAKWRLVGATHRQITKANELKDEEETKEGRALGAYNQLSAPFVYDVCNGLALKQLLRLNVEEDNRLNGGGGRKFDFSIYGEKSLEHVYPKSKVYHKEGDVFKTGAGDEIGEETLKRLKLLNRDDFAGGGSEHCIGNLVLLDKADNSRFNDKPFEDKKEIYFNVTQGFKSRNLLHSISVFAKSEWGVKDIQKTQNDFIKRLALPGLVWENPLVNVDYAA